MNTTATRKNTKFKGPKVYCQSSGFNRHSFYLVADGETYYLFTQEFRRGVHAYYSKGVTLANALDNSKGHRDCAIMRTMKKLRIYIDYVEKLHGIEVMEKTKEKVKRRKIREPRERVA